MRLTMSGSLGPIVLSNSGWLSIEQDEERPCFGWHPQSGFDGVWFVSFPARASTSSDGSRSVIGDRFTGSAQPAHEDYDLYMISGELSWRGDTDGSGQKGNDEASGAIHQGD